jgi:hypothetical protein
MFPNVRLMIVAIMASILGMSCGLGVFAVFRVNHDPFVRLPSATPPLQFAFSSATPVTFKNSAVNDSAVPDLAVASFGVRFEMSLPQTAGTAEPPPVAAALEAAAAPVASPASDADPETPRSVAAIEPGSAAQTPIAPAPADDAATETASADQTRQDASITPETAKPEASTSETAQPDSGRPESADLAAKKRNRAVVKRQAAAKPRRLRNARARAVAPSADHYSGFSQPAYQFTPAAQSKPVRRSARTARNAAARSATR